MGCSVALAFGVHYPERARALLLHWPVGGYRWKVNGFGAVPASLRFHQGKRTQSSCRARTDRKKFLVRSGVGPWASVIARDRQFAENFAAQDLERYLGIILTAGRGFFDRDTAPEPSLKR